MTDTIEMIQRWSKKVYEIKNRLSTDKHDRVLKITENKVKELIEFVQKKQLPLYNNMANYLPMLKGYIAKDIAQIADDRTRSELETAYIQIQEYQSKVAELKSIVEAQTRAASQKEFLELYAAEEKADDRLTKSKVQIIQIMMSIAILSTKILNVEERFKNVRPVLCTIIILAGAITGALNDSYFDVFTDSVCK